MPIQSFEDDRCARLLQGEEPRRRFRADLRRRTANKLRLLDEAISLDDLRQLTMEQLGPFLREEGPVTGDLALRLSQAFGCGEACWLGLQNRYDLETARARGVPQLPRVPGLIAAE